MTAPGQLTPAATERLTKIKQVTCPQCQAQPGKSCRRPNGASLGSAWVHGARRRKAADQGLYRPQ